MNSEACRLIVFIDKESLITAGTFLLQTTGTYSSVYSEKNENNRYLTKVLYDRTFVVNNADTQQRQFKIYLKIKSPYPFLATTNQVRNNEIKIAFFTQSPTNGSQISFISRFSYIDN